MDVKQSMKKILLAVLLGVVTAASAAAQSPSSVNDEARFLAGLPVAPGSRLAGLEASPAGKEHAAAIEKEWSELQSVRLNAMSQWAETELKPRIDGRLPLVYLFGGPDFISADEFYRAAPVYVLGGLEPIGSVPPLDAMKPDALAAGLLNLRESLTTMLKLSHFITDEMATELRRSELKGVLPILYVFLARGGNEVLRTDLVYIDRDDKVATSGAKSVPQDGVPGVRISFRSSGASESRLLYYFRMDLENAKIPAKPGFFTFLKDLGPANSYLKAASFILHNNSFSQTRDFLLAHSRTILQDDSGIPFKSFKPDKWNFVFFGTYVAPEPIFKGSFQPDLDKAFREAAPTRPLPFSTGYAHTRKPSLLLAIGK